MWVCENNTSTYKDNIVRIFQSTKKYKFGILLAILQNDIYI